MQYVGLDEGKRIRLTGGELIVHLFHTWSKWEEFKAPIIVTGRQAYRTKQKRTCLICGLTQTKGV